MVLELQSLLDLRRDAEMAAKDMLAGAIAARAKEEEGQARLVARWQAARHALDEARAPQAMATVAVAQAREIYCRRLDEAAASAARRAEDHRAGALAAAVAAEHEARAAFEEARRELEAAEKLNQRAEAEAEKVANRRAEDAAGDHALAAYVQRKTD